MATVDLQKCLNKQATVDDDPTGRLTTACDAQAKLTACKLGAEVKSGGLAPS